MTLRSILTSATSWMAQRTKNIVLTSVKAGVWMWQKTKTAGSWVSKTAKTGRNATSIAGAFMWQKKPDLHLRENEDSRKARIAQGEFIGLRIDAFWWNTIVRPLLSLLVAVAITFCLWVMDIFIGSDLLDAMICLLITLLFTAVFASSDTDENGENIPGAHAAMLTFFGKRYRIYRMEGDYWWTGKRLFLGRYKPEPIIGRQEPIIIKETGDINLGSIPISIWNNKDAEAKDLIDLIASDSTTVKATLVTEIRLLDPMAWTNSDDQLLAIGERSRSALRTAASSLTAEDNAAVKSILGTLMSGHTLITSNIQKVVKGNPRKTMVRSIAGIPLFETLKQPVTTIEIEDAKIKFEARLIKEADPDMLKAITNKKKINVEVRSVEEALEEVIESLGATLVRASVGTLILPEKITEAAEKAASESRQREGQIASAKTFAEAKAIMDKAKTPGDEVAAAIAAAADNPNVKVVFVPGADTLTRAAVAAATQINGGTTK